MVTIYIYKKIPNKVTFYLDNTFNCDLNIFTWGTYAIMWNKHSQTTFFDCEIWTEFSNLGQHKTKKKKKYANLGTEKVKGDQIW